MLDGFSERRIATGEAELYVRIGGAGPPLVCLHGYPQSHLTWRKVAPVLAERYTVVLMAALGYERFLLAGHDRWRSSLPAQ